MSNHSEQITLGITKGIEQGAAGVGATLGIYSFMIEHRETIIIFCTLGSFFIALLGYITSTALNWYYKEKHLELARLQQRRANDTPDHEDSIYPSGLPEKPNRK